MLRKRYADRVTLLYESAERISAKKKTVDPCVREGLCAATAKLPDPLDEVLNETRLWTGVPASKLLAVLLNGLDERFSGTV